GGGGMSEQLFGARTGNVLTKATIVLASIFLLNTIGLAVIYSRQDRLISPEMIQPQPGMSSAPVSNGEMGSSEDAEADVEALPEQ
ncbi:MAG: preprotein translocase subunit SecG, partial [Kiritimatiellae bacterium]|nr:preprotein translocase subunit SecG [Kiritimatiellia bacterium]